MQMSKAKQEASSQSAAVFLNIPYDRRFQSLYLAYIIGLVHLGFEPRATLGIAGGTRRLDKIIREIQRCRYSIHDLSKVQLDRSKPRTRRFNMPFELGLAVAWEQSNPRRHTWFVFEEVPYRIQKSLSDLNGTDPHIHGGRIQGVLRGLCNALDRARNKPSIPEMMVTYRIIRRELPNILKNAGTTDPFEARAFKDICVAAKIAAEQI